MKTTINQRIKEIADKLCGGNMSQLARVSGVNQPALRDVVGKRQVEPRFETLSKIANNSILNINGDWLLTGKGPMQRDEIGVLDDVPSKKADSKAIPVYNLQVTGTLKVLLQKDNSTF